MNRLRPPRILWGALSVSVVVQYVVLLVVRPHAPAPIPPTFVPMFAVMSVGLAAASFLLPRAGMKQALARRSFETRDEATSDGRDGSYRSTHKRRVFAAPVEVRRAAFAIYQTPLILSMALSEAIALMGFCLGFLGAPMGVASIFFAAGFGLVLFRFPTQRRVFAPIEERFGAALD